MSKEAMKLALEALENRTSLMKWQKARDAVREALAKQEQDEPVAMRYDFDGYGYKYIDSGSGSDWQTRIKDAEPVYTKPQPAQKPLSEAAIEGLAKFVAVDDFNYDFARAIEKAHGITKE